MGTDVTESIRNTPSSLLYDPLSPPSPTPAPVWTPSAVPSGPTPSSFLTSSPPPPDFSATSSPAVGRQAGHRRLGEEEGRGSSLGEDGVVYGRAPQGCNGRMASADRAIKEEGALHPGPVPPLSLAIVRMRGHLILLVLHEIGKLLLFFNFAPNLGIKSLNKFSHQLYLGPISALVRQVLKSALDLVESGVRVCIVDVVGLGRNEIVDGGAAGGDYSSKGGWLQPSVARQGGRMGDGDAVEGWKTAAAKEEATIVAGDCYGCGQEVGQLDPTVVAAVMLLCGSGLRLLILDGVKEEEVAMASKAATTMVIVCVGRRGRWDGKQRGSSEEVGIAGGGGREERNRGGRRRKRSDEELREEGEEGAAGEGYGWLEVATVVVEEKMRWWPGREGGSGVRRGLRQRERSGVR
ncbi:hypothetical protein BHE74_00045733 [Ensete ventricosum]|nr:hypothetical protein BHE74_00045733 [Ensete ventricosum]